MLEALPLLVTTFAFISIFLYTFSMIQIRDMRENWNVRRCQPFSMLFAQLIPTDPEIDPADFAAENFSFCINHIISGSMSGLLGPIMAIFSKQLDATQPLHSSVNTLRNSASNMLTNPFNSYMNILWKKFGFIVYGVSQVFMKFTSAFRRIFGIIISTIFAGMAMYKGILNVKNFMIKMCVIILYIIIALLFLLFVPLFQIIPIIIIPLITALAVAGVEISGGDAFNCVAPGTLVACKDGWRPVETLHVGDALREGTVTGILKGIPGGACVKIGDVVISNLHIVFDTSAGQWVHASDHKDAIPVASPDIVYCLTTSTRTWIVNGELLLRDWNDIPDTIEANERMEQYVWGKLNQYNIDEVEEVQTGLSLLPKHTHLFHKYEGYISIDKIKIHDMVFDGEFFTEVVGIFEGRCPGKKAGSLDAAWILNQTTNRWVHPILKCDIPDHGYNIITRSGKYSVNGDIRRDLTEIGCDRLYETRRLVLSLLNNRNDEEECNFT